MPSIQQMLCYCITSSIVTSHGINKNLIKTKPNSHTKKSNQTLNYRSFGRMCKSRIHLFLMRFGVLVIIGYLKWLHATFSCYLIRFLWFIHTHTHTHNYHREFVYSFVTSFVNISTKTSAQTHINEKKHPKYLSSSNFASKKPMCSTKNFESVMAVFQSKNHHLSIYYNVGIF